STMSGSMSGNEVGVAHPPNGAPPGLDAPPPLASSSSALPPVLPVDPLATADDGEVEDDEEVPLAVSARRRPPTVTFAPTPAASSSAASRPAVSSSATQRAAPSNTTDSAAGSGGATSSRQRSASPAPASPARRRSATPNPDVVLMMQAMAENTRLLVEGMRADTRLMVDGMRDAVEANTRVVTDSVRAMSALIRDARANSAPATVAPVLPTMRTAVPPQEGGSSAAGATHGNSSSAGAFGGGPSSAGVPASSAFPTTDDEPDVVDQFIANAVSGAQGNFPSQPLPPLPRTVDAARAGATSVSGRGDPPAALTARLRGYLPAARAAALALWTETFVPEQIGDMRLMTADEANAAAFGPMGPRRAKSQTPGPWLFPSVLAAAQAVRTYGDRVLIVWGDSRVVPRSCPRDLLTTTIQANIAAFADRIALMESRMGSAELYTLAACHAVLQVMEEAWQDPATALEYPFPPTFVDAAINNGLASARIIADARQTYTATSSLAAGPSSKRAGSNNGGPLKKKKNDTHEKDKCRNWNNGGCEDVCPFNRPHKCSFCDSTAHRFVLCEAAEKAKAKYKKE
ncbi:hypothetical protein HDU96_003183, partial [Phlyctochytrium bullatum]